EAQAYRKFQSLKITSAPVKRKADGPLLHSFRLLDGDLADHSGPIVVGADQAVLPGLARHESQVLRLAGSDRDLGPVGVEHLEIAEFDRLEELRRVELVHFLAVVFDMQPIGD